MYLTKLHCLPTKSYKGVTYTKLHCTPHYMCIYAWFTLHPLLNHAKVWFTLSFSVLPSIHFPLLSFSLPHFYTTFYHSFTLKFSKAMQIPTLLFLDFTRFHSEFQGVLGISRGSRNFMGFSEFHGVLGISWVSHVCSPLYVYMCDLPLTFSVLLATSLPVCTLFNAD